MPLAIIVAAVVLELPGDVSSFRYERGALLAEPWGLLSAHLMHLGWLHLALNIAALLITWFLLGRAIGTGDWCAVIVTCGVGVSLGLAWFSPAVAWHVGFSGILHGMLLAGALAGLRRMRLMATVLLALLLAKLGLEQFVSGDGATSMLIGGAVIVDAHLYGTIAGGFCGAWLLCAARVRRRAPLRRSPSTAPRRRRRRDIPKPAWDRNLAAASQICLTYSRPGSKRCFTYLSAAPQLPGVE